MLPLPAEGLPVLPLPAEGLPVLPLPAEGLPVLPLPAEGLPVLVSLIPPGTTDTLILTFDAFLKVVVLRVTFAPLEQSAFTVNVRVNSIPSSAHSF